MTDTPKITVPADDDELEALRSSNRERRNALGARGVKLETEELALETILEQMGPDAVLAYHRKLDQTLGLVEKQVDEMARRASLLAPPPPNGSPWG